VTVPEGGATPPKGAATVPEGGATPQKGECAVNCAVLLTFFAWRAGPPPSSLHLAVDGVYLFFPLTAPLRIHPLLFPLAFVP
jgi:hypothetical protein